jgi:hypothetical protein
MPGILGHTLRFCRSEYRYVRKTCVHSIGNGRRRRLASPRELAKQPSAHDALIAASAVTQSEPRFNSRHRSNESVIPQINANGL